MPRLKYILSILSYALKHFPGIYFCFILTVFSVAVELMAMSSLMPLSSIMTGESIKDSVITNFLQSFGIRVDAYTLLMVFVFLFTLRILTQVIVTGLNIYYSRELFGQLSSDALKTILCNFSLTEIESKSIGHFNSLAGDEANRSSQILQNILTLSGTVTLSVFYAVAIFLFSPTTLIGLIIFFCICLLFLFGVFKSSYRLGLQHILESKRTNSIFIDAMSNIRMIKSFRSENYVSGQYYKTLSKYMNTLFKVDFLNVLSKLLPVLILLGFSGIFFMVQKDVIREGVNLAFVITVIFYLLRFFPAIGMCLTSALRIISDAKAGKDVVSVVSRVGEIDSRELAIIEEINNISFKNVSFSYEENKPVFKNCDINFKSGITYALVGPSGSGKSTMANILLGFYEVSEGSVELNNISINKIKRDSLREKVLLLSQKTVAFNDTIYKNITLGTDLDEEEVWESLEKVELKETIQNLPKKLETELQYQGTNLSGGQLQRIGLARALIRNPDVVIFDESFSGLDSSTKLKVLTNIKEFGKNKILIFITHDIEIINSVDEIIDLEQNGRV